tara:strand:+ start:815 stop:1714 length:900 start_codon:yes stop_codon:yes gene_type:complete
MKTIIVGASGIIGYQLFLKLKNQGKKVIGTYYNNRKKGLTKFDLTKDKIKDKFKISKRDKIILLTAISNPSAVFKYPKFSKNLNVIATKKIIDDIKTIGCKIYFMSSIEVFNGVKGSYHENSIPKPLNLYGKQKLLIEKYLKKRLKSFCILRTSFIVGSDPKHRCPVKLTYDTLLKPNAKMAKDNYFAITSVNDLCGMIIKILFNKKFQKLKICHVSSKEKISRTELAKFVIKYSKLGFRMKFKETLFKFIKYSEPRGRQNNLISINEEINKYKYEDASTVIKNKIKKIEKFNETFYTK